MGRLKDFLTHFNVEFQNVENLSNPATMGRGEAEYLRGQVADIRLPELMEESILWNTNTLIDEEIPMKIQPLRLEFDSARMTGDMYAFFQQNINIKFFGAVRDTTAPINGTTKFGKLTHDCQGRVTGIREGSRTGGQINTQTILMTVDKYAVKYKPSGASEETMIEVDRIANSFKRHGGQNIWETFNEALGVPTT